MRRFTRLLVLLVLLLAACSPAEADPTNTPVPTTTNTPRPSATVAVGETPATPTETPIPSDTPEPTATNTPLPDLSNISILSYGNAGGGAYFITFTGIEGLDFSGLVFRAKGNEYICTIPEDYPDRLYCIGPANAFDPGTLVDIQIFLGDLIIWKGKFIVPYPQPTATNEARDNGGGESGGQAEPTECVGFGCDSDGGTE